MTRLQSVHPRTEPSDDDSQIPQQPEYVFPPLCGPGEVARATGYTYNAILRLQKRGRLRFLEHPRPIGVRRYSGVKLAALMRGEDPTRRRFFSKV